MSGKDLEDLLSDTHSGHCSAAQAGVDLGQLRSGMHGMQITQYNLRLARLILSKSFPSGYELVGHLVA